jgi:hypothetical protein
VFAAIALVVLSSCSDAGIPVAADPLPGSLEVAIANPPVAAGAVLVTVRGPGLGEPVSLSPAYQVFVQSMEDGAYTVAVVGERVTDRLFRIPVPDITALQAYSVTLVEVAGEDNQLRDDVSSYRLSVAGRSHQGGN